MPSADQIKALLKSHAERDDTRFYSIAMQIAASEARKGHGQLAQEIREMIDDIRRGISLRRNEPISIARPRGELADLLSVTQPKTRLADMVLEPDLRSRLNRILKEQKHIGKLKSHGLNPRQKLLLTGPPGCGKTMTASALAGELGTPLFIVRLDGLITKFMGETTAKLRLIFDAIEDTRAVYLFDEFDSIGTQRSFLNEVGEIRRVLNSFLMFIEEHKSNSLLIAATNHPQNLDFALFRRFDDLLEYGLPDKKMIVDMLEARLSEYKSANFDFERIAELASGLSFADLTRACEEAAKEMIISDRSQLATEDVLRSISDRFSFREKDRT